MCRRGRSYCSGTGGVLLGTEKLQYSDVCLFTPYEIRIYLSFINNHFTRVCSSWQPVSVLTMIAPAYASISIYLGSSVDIHSRSNLPSSAPSPVLLLPL